MQRISHQKVRAVLVKAGLPVIGRWSLGEGVTVGVDRFPAPPMYTPAVQVQVVAGRDRDAALALVEDVCQALTAAGISWHRPTHLAIGTLTVTVPAGR